MGTMRTIEDNNKLIAEFLGYVQPHPDYPNSTYWYKKDESPLTILPFNYDWNWLMEAVDKIESFEDDNRCAKYNVNIEQTFVEITENQTSMTITEADANTKIRAIYIAVINFIKYYNNEN